MKANRPMEESDRASVSEALFSLHLEQGHEVVLQVTGTSMWPTISPFENIVVRPLSRRPSFGEIVLLRNRSQMVIHRVIGRVTGERRGQRDLFLTKGDNCQKGDQPVTQSEIVGLAIGIKKGGSLFIPWELRTPYSWIIALLSGMEEKGYRFVSHILRRTLYLSWRFQQEWDRFTGGRTLLSSFRRKPCTTWCSGRKPESRKSCSSQGSMAHGK